MDREHYDGNAYWRERHLRTCYELGAIIDEQQDKIVALVKKNRRLERENWNLKHNRGKRR